MIGYLITLLTIDCFVEMKDHEPFFARYIVLLHFLIWFNLMLFSFFNIFLHFHLTVVHFHQLLSAFWRTALICLSQPRWWPRLTLIPPALCFIVYTSGGKQERRVHFRHKSYTHSRFPIHRLCLTSWLYFVKSWVPINLIRHQASAFV